jgi:hypothetical protein
MEQAAAGDGRMPGDAACGKEVVGCRRIHDERRKTAGPGQLFGQHRSKIAGVLSVTCRFQILKHGLGYGIGSARNGRKQSPASDHAVKVVTVRVMPVEHVQKGSAAQGELVHDALEPFELLLGVLGFGRPDVSAVHEQSCLGGCRSGVDGENRVLHGKRGGVEKWGGRSRFD